MRTVIWPLVLLLAAFSSSAEDLLGPADYLKIMEESKLRYNILAEPSKTPLTVMDCRRRDSDTRVVIDGEEKSLVPWSVTPAAEKLIAEGEVFFKAEQMSEAGEKYAAAIEADPQAVAAHFAYADTLLFGANKAELALEHYRKGIALDPTLPLGYFYSATALVRLGRFDEARAHIIKALVYHPAYEAIWTMAAEPQRWKARPVTRFKFEPPAGYLGGDAKKGIDVYGGKNFEWVGYATCKAAWAHEEKFAQQRAEEGGWSLEEERACVLNQILSQYNATEARLTEKKKNGVGAPEITEPEILAALPPLERHIFDVAKAQLLDGYIFFEIIGQHCPLSMSLMADYPLQKTEEYVRKHVIVAAE